MRKKALLFRTLALGILVFAFIFSLVRAKTQAIAHDEALTYVWFLDGGVDKLLHFDPNNHMLFTFLAKPLVKLLGPSELTLRAPALLGAAIYLTFVFLLSRRLFGDGFLFVVCAALLALHPLVMDLASAARGYGLGLALLLGAMHLFAGCLGHGVFDPEAPEWQRNFATASVLLGLAFAANLTNIVPVVSLVAAFAVFGLPIAAIRDGSGRSLLRRFVWRAVSPGVAVGSFLTWPFLLQARPYHFYVGYQKAADALRDVFNATFLYRWTDDFLGNLGGQPPQPGSWQQQVSDTGAYVMLPLLIVLLFGGAALGNAGVSPQEKTAAVLRRIFCSASVISVALIVALHAAANLKYPVSRTCLYVVPLFTVSGLLLAREIAARFSRRVLRWTGILAVVLLIADYAACLQMRSVRYNAYDADSREVFLAILRDGQSRGLTHARFGGTWWFEPEMGFYRRRFHAEWLSPYDVKDPSYPFQAQNTLTPEDYDYFLYTPANAPEIRARKVSTIFRDDKRQLTVIATARQ